MCQNQSRSTAVARFILVVSAFLLSLNVDDAVADEPKSFAERQKDWEKLGLDEIVKKPPRDMVSDPLQSLGRNNFTANCTVQMSHKQEDWDRLDFKFIHGDKVLASFRGHTKSVFGARNNLLVFVSYWPESNGASATAVDIKTGKELWKEQLDGIGGVKHFKYSNQVSMMIDGGYQDNEEGAVVIEGHESFGSYLEVRDLKTGKLLAHRRITNDEYRRRNDSKEN
jgi:hypothetical protein